MPKKSFMEMKLEKEIAETDLRIEQLDVKIKYAEQNLNDLLHAKNIDVQYRERIEKIIIDGRKNSVARKTTEDLSEKDGG